MSVLTADGEACENKKALPQNSNSYYREATSILILLWQDMLAYSSLLSRKNFISLVL